MDIEQSGVSSPKKSHAWFNFFQKILWFKLYILITISFSIFTLFLGYVYTYYYNPTLNLPGISPRINPIIHRLWGERPIPPNADKEFRSNLNALLIPKDTSLPVQDFTDEITWLNKKTLSFNEIKGKSFLILSINRAFCGFCANAYPFFSQWELDFSAYKTQFPIVQTAAITMTDSSGVNIERDSNQIKDTLKVLATDIAVGITASDSFLESVHISKTIGVPIFLLIDPNGLIRYQQVGIQNLDLFPYLIAELIKQEINPDFKLCLTTNYFGCRIYR
jgi:hypothetical protein